MGKYEHKKSNGNILKYIKYTKIQNFQFKAYTKDKETCFKKHQMIQLALVLNSTEQKLWFFNKLQKGKGREIHVSKDLEETQQLNAMFGS